MLGENIKSARADLVSRVMLFTNTPVAVSSLCQARGYFPSHRALTPLGQYQLILSGDRGTGVSTICPSAQQ